MPAAGAGSASSALPAAEGTLSVVAWAGMLNGPLVKPFEGETGCKVKVTAAGSSNQIVARLRGEAAKYDVVSASADVGRLLIAGKQVAPIDTSLVPAWSSFRPALRSPQATTVGGVHYGVATQWAPNTLLYNTAQVKPAPTSWGAIYGRAFRGRISVPNNPMQIADAALYLMASRPALGIRDPYELTRPQLRAAVSLLRRQKALVAGYWNYPADEVEDFKNAKAVVGSGWPWQVATLRASGVAVADTVPREGATGWIDSWMISAHARHPGCAYRWLRYVSSAPAQARLSSSYGASPANPLACPLMDDVRKGSCAAFHGDAPESYLASIRFWKTPQAPCGYRGRTDCATYVDWQKAWVDVRR